VSVNQVSDDPRAGGADDPTAVPETSSPPARPAAQTVDVPVRRGGHLHEVDIVRIVTFAGVIFDHTVSGTTFVNNVAANAVQMVFHYTRNAFFALTGFVLTYQYRDRELKAVSFWRRRFKLIGLPYLTWSIFYWLYGIYAPPYIPPGLVHFREAFGSVGAIGVSLHDLGYELITGSAWYHLYFVFVTMQFYLVFPLVLRFLRWSWGYHRYLFAGSLAFHLVLLHYMSSTRPRFTNYGAFEILWNHLNQTLVPYQFYLLAGCLAALHLESFRAFIVRFRWGVVSATAVVAVASVCYFLRLTRVMDPSSASNVFKPYSTPLFVGIVLSLYAAGTLWSERRTKGSFWDTFLKKTSDRSFGIFLAHALALQEVAPTIQRFRYEVYAPYVTAAAYVLVVTLTVIIVEMLRRGPVSLITTGRPMIPLAQQSLRGVSLFAVTCMIVGAVMYWPLAVPAGRVAMTVGVLTLGWNLLGRAVHKAPAPIPALK
jgi:peptidoglycan/LPS O-acetylase OafA/YrhL